MRFGRIKLSAIVAWIFIFAAVILAIFNRVGWSIAALSIALGIGILIVVVCHDYLVSKVYKELNSLRKIRAGQFEVNGDALTTNMLKKVERRRNSEQSSTKGKPAQPEVIGNLIESEPFLGGVGPKFEFAVRSNHAKGRLETFALRTRSHTIRDAFARAATNLHYDTEDILKILRSQRAGALPGITSPKSWDTWHLTTLARVLANQRHAPGDIDDAELIYNQLIRMHGLSVLGKTDIYVYGEILEALRRFSDLDKLFKKTKLNQKDSVHFALMKANSLSQEEEPKWEAWLGIVNELFVKHKFSKIFLNDSATGQPFDRVQGTPVDGLYDGPLVTVIIPTFNGAEFISTALGSLRNQSWKNLQVIIVDDGSPEENFQNLEEVCRNFPEVVLIRQTENLGAYPARNLALEYSEGEFITVHDDDDWSHPEKIATQIKFLLDNPETPANMSRHVRTTEDLKFNRINNNPSFSQPNFSSLMFRRELLEHVGKWDVVSRGADAEFKDRIVAATGKAVPVVSKAPLSFTRTHAASLTAGEIGRGYIDPSRLFYQASYQRSHELVRGSQEWRNQDFARPLNMGPGMSGKSLGQFDVVFATDYAFPGGTSSLTLNEVEAASAAGLRVGMINLFSPVNAGISTVTERALEVGKSPNVEILSLKDIASISLLVVRHPSVLQFADKMDSNLRVGRTEIIVNNPVVMAGGIAYGFDLKEVAANAARLFGENVTIYSETEVTKKQTSLMTRRDELSDQVWPGFVNDYFTVEHMPNDQRKPVIGRHSRNSPNKWPSRMSVYKTVYSKNEVYDDIRVLGGISKVPARAQELLKDNTTVYEFNGVKVSEFLEGLDFWVYYHGDEWIESFGMAIVEAMSAGLVVILPPYMEVNFGSGAIYAEPEDVQSIVSDLWKSPPKYEKQSTEARRVAAERYSQSAFLNRLEYLVRDGENKLNKAENPSFSS